MVGPELPDSELKFKVKLNKFVVPENIHTPPMKGRLVHLNLHTPLEIKVKHHAFLENFTF